MPATHCRGHNVNESKQTNLGMHASYTISSPTATHHRWHRRVVRPSDSFLIDLFIRTSLQQQCLYLCVAFLGGSKQRRFREEHTKAARVGSVRVGARLQQLRHHLCVAFSGGSTQRRERGAHAEAKRGGSAWVDTRLQQCRHHLCVAFRGSSMQRRSRGEHAEAKREGSARVGTRLQQLHHHLCVAFLGGSMQRRDRPEHTKATPPAHVDVAAHMLVLEKLDDSRVVTGFGSDVERACFLQCFDVRTAENRQGKQHEEEASEPSEQASSHRPQVRPAVQNAKGGQGEHDDCGVCHAGARDER
mmetsp:Transcript_41677/g.128539  ORF Transcript_41677/g.128539 Transcript_41677/m.128539 type:complete len:302 (-) Transcript_41677:33-938(-)